MKKCFIISPIGQPDSPTREHADDVYACIIQPAMEACGLKPLRSDHLHEPGKITDQMFREILGSDLCVAVLTGYNPNVFYELAIAQATSRPVAILIEKGQELPFDVRDHRCVAYDLKPRSLLQKTHVNELIAQVQNLERQNWRVDSVLSRFPDAFRLPRVEPQHDIFLSCPVGGARTDEQFREIRSEVVKCLACLEEECQFRVFYAGRGVESKDSFDEADFTVTKSVQGMAESRYYLLIYPDQLVSSVLVEAGMALALNKSSVYFVRSRKHLPFMLQHVDKAFPVKIYEYEKTEHILMLLRQHKHRLFQRGQADAPST